MAVSTIRASARTHYDPNSSAIYWVAPTLIDTGAALYAVVQDTTASPELRIYKADDRLTPTTWTEQNSVNSPSVQSTAPAPFAAFYEPTVGHIYTVSSPVGTTLTVDQFSVATDTWQTSLLVSSDTVVRMERNVRIVVRSNGDWYVFFTSSADDADIGYWRSIGGTISTAATGIFAGNDTTASHVLDAGIDSTGMIWVAFFDAANEDIKYTTISTGDVISTAVVIDSSFTGTETTVSAGGRFNLYDDAGTDKIKTPYLTATPQVLGKTVTLESAAASGNVSVAATIEGTTADIGARTPLHSARLGSLDYTVWWDDASSGTINYATRAVPPASEGTIWDAQIAWKTGVQRPSDLLVVDDGLGVVYMDGLGTTVLFDWLVAPTSGGSLALVGTAAGSSAASATGPISDKTLAATLAASSAASGAIAKAATLAASSAGSSAASSTGIGIGLTLAASAVGSSAAALSGGTKASTLAGSIAGAALASLAGGTIDATLIGSSAGASTLAALLSKEMLLAGSSAGSSFASGDIVAGTFLALAGTAAGASAVAGSIAVLSSLAASSQGSSASAASLLLDALIAGSSAGASNASGAINTAAILTASSQGASAASGSVSLLASLIGAVSGASAASGDISLLAVLELAGIAAGSSAASGSVEVFETISGLSAGSSAATAIPLVTISLDGVSSGGSTTQADLDMLATLLGSVQGSSFAILQSGGYVSEQVFGSASRLQVAMPVAVLRDARGVPVLAIRLREAMPIGSERIASESPIAVARVIGEYPVGVARSALDPDIAIARSLTPPPIATLRTKRPQE